MFQATQLEISLSDGFQVWVLGACVVGCLAILTGTPGWLPFARGRQAGPLHLHLHLHLPRLWAFTVSWNKRQYSSLTFNIPSVPAGGQSSSVAEHRIGRVREGPWG